MTATQNIVSGPAGRYATALFELARQEKSLTATGRNLKEFLSLLDKSDDLQRLVSSPVFSADEQVRAIDAVLKKARITGLAANMLKLAAQNRRLFLIKEIISGFGALVAANRGEVSAEVISARKLTTAQASKLKAELKASVGHDVQLHSKIDPDILGGLIVKVGSRMVDDSLKTKLQSMKIAMKGA